jgi:hypothetical protein
MTGSRNMTHSANKERKIEDKNNAQLSSPTGSQHQSRKSKEFKLKRA